MASELCGLDRVRIYQRQVHSQNDLGVCWGIRVRAANCGGDERPRETRLEETMPADQNTPASCQTATNKRRKEIQCAVLGFGVCWVQRALRQRLEVAAFPQLSRVLPQCCCLMFQNVVEREQVVESAPFEERARE